MISLRWRYALRGLWMNKTRTLLVILSIGVGIFAFGLIAGAGSALNLQLPANYQAIHPASAILHVSPPIDDTMLDAIRRMPEVGVAEGRTRIKVRFQKGNSGWHDMDLLALEDYDHNQVDIVQPHQGAWPPPDQALLIERNSLFLVEAQVGDSILVEMSDGLQRTMPLAGLVHDMNQPPAQITGIPYAYVDRDTLEWLGVSRNFNSVHLLAARDRLDWSHTRQVAHAVTDRLEENGYTVSWTEVPEPGKHFTQDFLPTILLILSVLAVLALALSGFLVINVITAMLTQQTRQIGVMKAIGARSPQIMRLYLLMVVVFGAAALAVAIPLGALAGFRFSQFVAAQLNFDIKQLDLPPQILLLEIAVGMVAPVLAALFPIRMTARLTVREAIADQGLSDGATEEGRLMRAIGRVQALLPISRPGRISLRNTFRRRGRLARTLIPLVLSGAVFMSVLSVRASLFSSLEETLASQGFDVQIVLERPQRMQRLAYAVDSVAGIQAAEFWQRAEGIPLRANGSEGDSLVIYALPPASQVFQPQLIEGRWLQESDTNAIVVPVGLAADEPGGILGGEVELRIGGKEEVWHVVGVYWTFQSPIAPHVIYVNQDYFWREQGDYGRANIVRITTETHDAATHAQVLRAVEERLQAATIEVGSTRTASADRDIFTERFNIITVILTMMAALLATVGGLGLMATMGINVLERTREIGVMRAIGASTVSVLYIFIGEGIVIGILSWLGGLVLSLPMSRLLGWRIGLALLKWPLGYVYDLRAPIFWLGIVLVIAVLASVVPARSAARLSVRATLAYE